MKFKVFAIGRYDYNSDEIIIDDFDDYLIAYNAYSKFLKDGHYDCYLTIGILESEGNYEY